MRLRLFNADFLSRSKEFIMNRCIGYTQLLKACQQSEHKGLWAAEKKLRVGCQQHFAQKIGIDETGTVAATVADIVGQRRIVTKMGSNVWTFRCDAPHLIRKRVMPAVARRMNELHRVFTR